MVNTIDVEGLWKIRDHATPPRRSPSVVEKACLAGTIASQAVVPVRVFTALRIDSRGRGCKVRFCCENQRLPAFLFASVAGDQAPG